MHNASGCGFSVEVQSDNAVAPLLPLGPGSSSVGVTVLEGNLNSPVWDWNGSTKPHCVSVLLILIANTQVN